MRSKTNRSRRAFTLIEALAVVTIVSIAIPTAMHAISFSARAAGIIKEQARATEIATNELNLAVLTEQYQGAGDANGADDGKGGGTTFHWELQQQDWDPNSAPNVEQLTVTVTWNDGGRSRSTTVSTLVYAVAAVTGGLAQ